MEYHSEGLLEISGLEQDRLDEAISDIGNELGKPAWDVYKTSEQVLKVAFNRPIHSDDIKPLIDRGYSIKKIAHFELGYRQG